MKIRVATVEDVGVLTDHACEFLTSGPYVPFMGCDRTLVERMIAHLVDSDGNAGVVVGEADGRVVGGLAMFIAPAWCDGEIEANEIGWWVRPQYRGKLLGPRLVAAAESLARERGAVRIRMIVPPGESENVARYLHKRGYEELEVVYQKGLA